ncbi:MAG: hypothetical protein NTW87_32220 [Planctomycetota bacterium]|nr:hypothetical protein [Planctomycetota bacterium]
MSRLIAAATLLAALVGGVARGGEAANPYFAITVVDDQTGRGVPLVELRTVNDVRSYTDSNGVVAFGEPGLMNQKVFFHVKSHGYELPADGFGYRGTALDVKPGGAATLKIRRINVAERLYRITGEGIYRDSVLVGQPVPIRQPLLNAQVLGQDSVQMAEYRGKLYWFWGDTNKPSYPLGHFGTSGATSLLPGKGGLDPAKGVDLTYFADANGFARPMCAVKGDGMKWVDAVFVVPDDTGAERLVARFARHKSLGEVHERGLVIFNDKTEALEPLVIFAPGQPYSPCSHAFRYRVGQQEYIYLASPYPTMRVKADFACVKDPRTWESFTCLKAGARYAKGDPQLDRDAAGGLLWAWKADTSPLGPAEQNELLKAAKIKPEEARYRIADAETGKPVQLHAGSIAYNEFRRRWIMIFHAAWGTPSNLGEVYYAEAESPEGPWLQARKIVTHEKYSFYNVKHHPLFDQEGGRVIYFEGTYTAMFSGVTDPTPRYDYNQVMYRLDLSDPRLKMPPGK